MIRNAQDIEPEDDRAAVVSIEGVCKTYRRGGTDTRVLDGVDLTVNAGECVFLAGPSGSGKTTLLSILGCILTADRGKVVILQHDVRRLDAEQRVLLRRDRIGFVFQRFELIRGLSAIENVCLPLVLRGESHRATQRRGTELLDAVGLADKRNSKPQNLSAGQCQRVAMARALAADPDLILADEPTASLDGASGPGVMKLLRKLTTEEGKTAIVVTHDQRIFPFADRVLWLEGGRIAPSCEPPGAEPAVCISGAGECHENA